MKNFSGKVAVITGAASGIGQALALALADEGARLAISDLNEAGLEETRAAAAERGAEVHVKKLDVADRQAFFAYADEVVDHYGSAHLVINNAGVALTANVIDMSMEDFEWLMGINFWGVIHGTKAFLPHLVRGGEGHIVNISSVFGIIAVPTQSAYNAAKFAVRGFTEALRQELDIADGGVSCTCVHPGGIKTNIVVNARIPGDEYLGNTREEMAQKFKRAAGTTSKKAAKVILRGVKRNQRRVLIGADAHVIVLLQRLLPTAYQRIVTMGAKSQMKTDAAK